MFSTELNTQIWKLRNSVASQWKKIPKCARTQTYARIRTDVRKSLRIRKARADGRTGRKHKPDFYYFLLFCPVTAKCWRCRWRPWWPIHLNVTTVLALSRRICVSQSVSVTIECGQIELFPPSFRDLCPSTHWGTKIQLPTTVRRLVDEKRLWLWYCWYVKLCWYVNDHADIFLK